MRTLKIALAVVSVAAGLQAQVRAQPPSVRGGLGIANVPLVFFGAGMARGNIINPGQINSNQGLMNQQSWYWNSYAMRPYMYYWNGVSRQAIPTSPSYENPGTVQPVGELPPQLTAPDNGKSGAEWADVRFSFTGASAKVSEARRSVEELRARLQALGQSPRANLVSGVSTAEAALKTAQERMTAGDLEESVREIQRSNYLAAQVLKEFGR